MQTLWQDIRYGWRILRRNPGFATVVVLTLAIGIGANAAIFSVVYAVLLRSLPYPNPDRIVIVFETDANRKLTRGTVSPAEFLDWQEMNHSFEALSAIRPSNVTLTGNGEPEQTWAVHTSGNLFRMLGVKPALGRDFVAEEEQPGHEKVAMISYGLWQRRFGGDTGVIGKSISIDFKPYTLIGVLPRSFSLFGTNAAFDVWVPFAFDRAQLDRENHELVVIGRLKSGVPIRVAQTEMETIMAALQKQYPKVDQKLGIRIAGFQQEFTKNFAPGAARCFLPRLFSCCSSPAPTWRI